MDPWTMAMLICALIALIFAVITVALMMCDLVSSSWGPILDWNEWALITFALAVLFGLTAAVVYIIGLLVGGIEA